MVFLPCEWSSVYRSGIWCSILWITAVVQCIGRVVFWGSPAEIIGDRPSVWHCASVQGCVYRTHKQTNGGTGCDRWIITFALSLSHALVCHTSAPERAPVTTSILQQLPFRPLAVSLTAHNNSLSHGPTLSTPACLALAVDGWHFFVFAVLFCGVDCESWTRAQCNTAPLQNVQQTFLAF